MPNFWTQLNTPILALSPMDGITDLPFRLIVNKYSQPDISYTEFISIDGLAHGASRVFDDMRYDKIERPIIVQFFGNDPKLFYIAAQIACELGFDGIDINMGCPAKSVINRGAGAGLINNPNLARQIIAASKQGVLDWTNDTVVLDEKIYKQILRMKKTMNLETSNSNKQEIPISVKTRIGYKENTIEKWIPELLKERPAAIAMHGRTYKQMYTGKSDWQTVDIGGHIVTEFNKINSTNIKYLGNGDIKTTKDIQVALDLYQIDGILIGRGLLGYPWLIEDYRKFSHNNQVTIHSLQGIIKVAIEHTNLHDKLKDTRAFVQIRKHLAWYAKSFKGATKVRQKLVRARDQKEIIKILNCVLTK